MLLFIKWYLVICVVEGVYILNKLFLKLIDDFFRELDIFIEDLIWGFFKRKMEFVKGKNING